MVALSTLEAPLVKQISIRRIVGTIDSNVGLTADNVRTTTPVIATAILLKNTHASQSLFIDADDGPATANSYPIVAGDQVYLEVLIDSKEGLSIIGDGAATTFVILLMR